jgi:hypothetical protein
MEIYRVNAHWDAEASVWWADSEDIKGVAAESATLDGLHANVLEVVPEMLQYNHGVAPGTDYALTLVLSDGLKVPA